MRTLIVLALLSVVSFAGATTPKTELVLRKTKLQVPEKFQKYFSGGEGLFLPPGFTVSVFAAGIHHPRFFAWRPDGTLFSGTGWPGVVYSFPDEDRDGVADTVIEAIRSLKWPHSLAFYNGDLYVAETHAVRKFHDPDGDGRYTAFEDYITGLPTEGFSDTQPNHVSRTILFDSARGYVYLGIGSSCDVCRENDSMRAAISRFNIDGSGKVIFARGLRNPVGLDFDPVTGKLWTTVPERNDFPDYPDEPVTEVKEGGFYGWPFAHGNRQWMDIENLELYKVLLPITAQDSADVATMQVADVGLPPHTTPLGIHFYTRDQFPQEYRNKAFVALHGSGREQLPALAGYNVVLLQKDALDNWTYAEFLNGFLSSDTSFWGRPAGLITDEAGNMYLSSDFGIPAVYRISYDPDMSVDGASADQFSSEFFPNPYSREQGSRLRFSVPGAGFVKITLYDARGNAVQALFSGHTDAGEFQLPVRLQNYAYGLYLYRVEFSSGTRYFTSSGRILIE